MTDIPSPAAAAAAAASAVAPATSATAVFDSLSTFVGSAVNQCAPANQDHSPPRFESSTSSLATEDDAALMLMSKLATSYDDNAIETLEVNNQLEVMRQCLANGAVLDDEIANVLQLWLLLDTCARRRACLIDHLVSRIETERKYISKLQFRRDACSARLLQVWDQVMQHKAAKIARGGGGATVGQQPQQDYLLSSEVYTRLKHTLRAVDPAVVTSSAVAHLPAHISNLASTSSIESGGVAGIGPAVAAGAVSSSTPAQEHAKVSAGAPSVPVAAALKSPMSIVVPTHSTAAHHSSVTSSAGAGTVADVNAPHTPQDATTSAKRGAASMTPSSIASSSSCTSPLVRIGSMEQLLDTIATPVDYFPSSASSCSSPSSSSCSSSPPAVDDDGCKEVLEVSPASVGTSARARDPHHHASSHTIFFPNRGKKESTLGEFGQPSG